MSVNPCIINNVSSGGTITHNTHIKWPMQPVVPRILNDVLSVSSINHDIHFAAWKAQYLLRCEIDPYSSVHCK